MIQGETERMGLDAAFITPLAARLSDANLLRPESPVMEANEQMRAAATVHWRGWLVVISVLVVPALLIVGLSVGLGD